MPCNGLHLLLLLCLTSWERPRGLLLGSSGSLLHDAQVRGCARSLSTRLKTRTHMNVNETCAIPASSIASWKASRCCCAACNLRLRCWDSSDGKTNFHGPRPSGKYPSRHAFMWPCLWSTHCESHVDSANIAPKPFEFYNIVPPIITSFSATPAKGRALPEADFVPYARPRKQVGGLCTKRPK